VILPRDSFARLSAMDVSGLPGPESLTACDGCRLAYRHYPGCDSATIVVLIHGSAGYGDQLHALASGIAASGAAQVYTLDMRGHGLSGGKAGHAVRYVEQPCEDIAEFVGFLERKTPGARIVLGGHSAGGGLVLRFCRRPAGRRISACLFLAPYLGIGSPTIRPLFGGWVKVRVNRLRALALASVLGVTHFNNSTVVSFDLTACSNRQSYTPSWSFNTLLAMGPGCWAPHAGGIDGTKAVLVIAGDRDECFRADAYPEAFQAIAPQAEVRTLENVGHWDVLVDPKVVTVTTEWLSAFNGRHTSAPPRSETSRSPARA
jgi:pimeloyl-ACP methyl ester carboxylesterase